MHNLEGNTHSFADLAVHKVHVSGSASGLWIILPLTRLCK